MPRQPLSPPSPRPTGKGSSRRYAHFYSTENSEEPKILYCSGRRNRPRKLNAVRTAPHKPRHPAWESAVASETRHRFRSPKRSRIAARHPPLESAVVAPLCRRSPKPGGRSERGRDARLYVTPGTTNPVVPATEPKKFYRRFKPLPCLADSTHVGFAQRNPQRNPQKLFGIFPVFP